MPRAAAFTGALALVTSGVVAACGGNVVVDGIWATNPDGASTSSSSGSSSSGGSWPVTSGGGACGDTSSDPHNCGTCGHDCLGGGCIEGRCQPYVIAMNGYPNAITTDRTALYWTDLVSGVMRIPKGGTEPTMLASANAPQGIAVDAANVYWTAKDQVTSVPLLGGATSTLYAGAIASGSWGTAVDATQIYWTDKTLDVLQAKPLKEGPPAILASGLSSPDGVVVDDAMVYFANGTNQQTDGAILAVPKGGGAQVIVAPMQKGPRALAIDDTELYWTDSAPFFPSPTGLIMKAPKTGGATVKLADASGDPLGIAVDTTYVYWVNGDVGTVMRVPKTGGSPELLASQQRYVNAIAVDDNAIYWTTQSQGGNVVLLAK